MQIGTVFSNLLDDYAQRVNVVNVRRSRSEAYLLTIYGGIKMPFFSRSCMTLEMTLEIAYKPHIPRQLSQIFRLPFSRIFTVIPSVHSSENASLNQASSNMG